MTCAGHVDAGSASGTTCLGFGLRLGPGGGTPLCD
jgi:hypothetical protein